MTQFTGTVVLSPSGNTGGTASLVTGTNVWAGGGSAISTPVAPDAAANDFSVGNVANTVVTANDVIIICRRLFQDQGQNNSTRRQGEYRLTNCIFNSYNTVTGVNTQYNDTSSIITNCTFYKFDTNYNVVGRWNPNSTAKRQQWTDVNWWGRVNAAGLGGHSLFWGRVTTDSFFNNLSLWNGADLITGNAFVGTFQGSSLAPLENTLLGPGYVLLNGVANSGLVIRHAPQGTSGTSRREHAGLVANPDFRALEQLESTAVRYFIEVDVAAHVWYVNPLFARPQSTVNSSLELVNVYNTSVEPGGRLQYFTATNPEKGIGTDHRFTFNSGDLTPVTVNAAGGGNDSTLRTGGLYLPSTTAYTQYTSTGTDDDSTGFTTDVVRDNIANGMFFRVFDYLCTDNNSGSSPAESLTNYRRNARVIPTTKVDRTYRHYAWQQQWPTEAATDSNGVPQGPVTVLTPSDGAPDDVNRDVTALPSTTTNPDPVNTLVRLTQQDGPNAAGLYVQKIRSGSRVWESFTGTTVAQARASGFNNYLTTGFQNSHNIAKATDLITTQADYSTVATVRADVDTANGVNEGSAMWAATKLEAWDRITTANVGTTNAYVPMLASYSNRIIDYGNNSVRFDRSASGIGSTATSITLPTIRLNTDDSVGGIQATNITLVGDLNYAETETKCSLNASTALTIQSVGSATTLNGLGLISPTINLVSTFTGNMSRLAIGPSSDAIVVTNWSTEQTVTSLVARSSVGVTFRLINTSTGTVTLDSLFGADRDFSLSGGITLTSDTAITITVPAGSGDGTVIDVVNDGSTTTQVTYTAGTNVTFVEEANYDFRVTMANITGNSWALYGGTATNITLTPLFSSHNGDSITGVTSGTADATYGSVPNLGAAGGVTVLYLVTGNAQNATRTVKMMVTDPQITSSLPRPADTVITAISAPQLTGTATGHFGTIHSVTVHTSGTIGTGTTQPAAGDAIIELSNLAANRQADEESTQNIWADARNTLGWKNAVMTQRATVLIAQASGFQDTYDLFLPDGFGGFVKNVFLTDLDGGASRTGIHVLTGTRYTSDDRSSVTTSFTPTSASPTIARNAIPVLEIDNGARQFIFQQPENNPTAVTTQVLDERGVIRQNFVNLGVGGPIIQADGSGLDTSFSTTES